MTILFEASVVVILAGVLFLYVNKYVGLFLLLAMISHFYPFYGRSSYVAFHSVLYGCILYGAIVVAGDENTQKIMMDMMCIVALANIGLQILQYFDVDPLYRALDGGHSSETGFMTNVNETSALLAFCFPAFMRWKFRAGKIKLKMPRERELWVRVPVLTGPVWLIPLLVFGFVAAHSSGGIVATAIGLLAYAIISGVWLLPAIAVTVIGIYWTSNIDSPVASLGGRVDATVAGLKAYKQHWLMGYGLGHWKIVFLQKGILPQYFAQAHNEYVQGLFEMGVGFGVILAGYLVNIARRIKREKRLHLPVMALVIILMNSAINFPFHIAPTAAIAVIWFALIELELRREA